MSLETDPEERERLYSTGGMDVNNLPADWNEYSVGEKAYSLGLLEEEESFGDMSRAADESQFVQIVREELEAVLAEKAQSKNWEF